MGSGGLIVMNEDKCAVDMARFFMDFCQDESCGKCNPCREGTKRMLEILTNICTGKGKEGDIELLESMASVIKDASLCGLGQTAPNPVLSTIRYFRDEYVEHIRDKKCRAAVCSALFKSPCQHTCPIGMDIPAYTALIRDDRLTDAYKVLLKTNPFPSACGRVCDHQCMSKCRRGLLDEPVSIKFLKRYITDNAPRPEIKPVPVTRKEKIAVIGAGPADSPARGISRFAATASRYSRSFPRRAACSAGASPRTGCRGRSSARKSTTSASSASRSSATPGWAVTSPGMP